MEKDKIDKFKEDHPYFLDDSKMLSAEEAAKLEIPEEVSKEIYDRAYEIALMLRSKKV